MWTWSKSLAVLGAALALLLVASPVAARGLNTPLAAMVTLNATLTGSVEVPGPGDPDGTGTAKLTIDTVKNEVCYTITTANIVLPAAAAHIHKAAAGAAGGVVLPLTAPDASGNANACATGDAAVVADMVANAALYYVNVHTSEYPDGAVRGQLAGGGAAAPAPTNLPTTGAAEDSRSMMTMGALLLLLAGVAMTLVMRRSTSAR